MLPVWLAYVYDAAAALTAMWLAGWLLMERQELLARRGSHRRLVFVDPAATTVFYRQLAASDLLCPRPRKEASR